MGLGTVIGKIFTKGFAKKAGRLYLDVVFGTGCETFEKSIKGSIFKNVPKGKLYKGADFNGFWGKMGNAVEAMSKEEAAVAAKNGGFLKNMWYQLRTTPRYLWKSFKSGSRFAKAAGKSGFMGGLKCFGKAFMKRMPLIGGVMMLAGHVPNIVSAFKNDGFGAGMKEIGKSIGKLGLDMAGFVVGQALIPIPFVGGIIGSIVLGGLGNLIFGKGHKEKMAERKAQGQQTTQNVPNGQYQTPSYTTNPQQQNQTYQVIDWQPPQMAGILNNQELMQVQNQLYGPWNSLRQYGAYA